MIEAKPLEIAGARLARRIIDPISIPKLDVSKTTSPAEIPNMPLRAKYADKIRHKTFAIWKVTHAAALKRPFIRSSLKPASCTVAKESFIRPTARRSNPWARVTVRRVVISLTRDDIFSIWLRKSSLYSFKDLRRRIIVIEAIGATTMKKIKKFGTRIDVTTIAPIKPLRAANPPSDI